MLQRQRSTIGGSKKCSTSCPRAIRASPLRGRVPIGMVTLAVRFLGPICGFIASATRPDGVYANDDGWWPSNHTTAVSVHCANRRFPQLR